MKQYTFVLFLGLTLISSNLSAQVPQFVPQLVSYQGRIAVDSANFEGAGQFKFALVNGNGSVTFWSNDGTSAGGSEPAAAVTLTVTSGLYSVLLGDTLLGNMTTIPASTFASSDVRLRVWFDDSVHGSQLLTPDQRLAPSVYLADGAVTTAAIAPGAVNGTSVGLGSLNGANIASGSLNFSHLAVPSAPSPGQVLSFDGNGFSWQTAAAGDSVFSLNGTSAYYNAGRVGLGTTTPMHHLSIIGGPSWTANGWKGAVELDNGSAIAWQTNSGGQRFGLGHTNGSFLMFRTASDPGTTSAAATYDFAVTDFGNVGVGTTNPGSKFQVQTDDFFGITHTNGDVVVGSAIGVHFLSGILAGWLGTSSDHPLFLHANGTNSPALAIATSGNVGIGATDPLTKLHVRGTGFVEASVESTNERAILSLNSGIGGSDRVWTLESGVFGNAGWFGIYDRTALQARMTISPGGNVGIGTGTTLPAYKVDVRTGTNSYGLTHSDGNIRVGTWVGQAGNGGFGGWVGTVSDHPLYLFARNGVNPSLIVDNGLVSVPVLQITGGADIAEPFPMQEEAIEKGSVVVIDSDHPGRLKRSSKAYDRRVAGIISGANGIKPGIALHQEGAMEGDQNVALSGRVYVAADASASSIEPGDLLTTSDTPGHAMKVVDHSRAQGAVLGKAMTSLAKGTKGQVLVLVTLQ